MGRRSPATVVLLVVTALVAAIVPATNAQATPKTPRTTVLDGSRLRQAKVELRHGSPALRRTVAQLTRRADAWLNQGPWTVVDKPRPAPSGDVHDYLSQAPYWWPTQPPSAENPWGCPYVQRDGERNPEVDSGTDRQDVEIHDTGNDGRGMGEGVYVGSANTLSDRSDNVQIPGNTIGPDVGGENIDIKEGTTGARIVGNTFDGNGLTGAHYDDSWVDVKGNNLLVENNTGRNTTNDGYQNPYPAVRLGVRDDLPEQPVHAHGSEWLHPAGRQRHQQQLRLPYDGLQQQHRHGWSGPDQHHP